MIRRAVYLINVVSLTMRKIRMEINGRKFVEYQAHSDANAEIRTIPQTLDFAAVCLTCG